MRLKFCIHTHPLVVLWFCLSQSEMPLHVERLVQSVKALCSSLAAVETPDITAALNQLPACPCRLQPKVQKVVPLNTFSYTRNMRSYPDKHTLTGCSSELCRCCRFQFLKMTRQTIFCFSSTATT